MALNFGTRSRLLQGGGLIPVILKAGIHSAPDGSTQNSSITLPAKAIVMGVWLDVRVAEVTGTTKTLDVGRTSDPDGYLASADVSSTGLKNSPLGAIYPATNAGDIGGGGEVIVYDADSNDWVEFRGDIYVLVHNVS